MQEHTKSIVYIKIWTIAIFLQGQAWGLGLSGSQINTLSDCSNTSAWATPQRCSHPKPVPASSSRKRGSSRIHSLSVVYFCSMITALTLLKDFSVTSAHAILPNLKQLQLSATERFWVWIDWGRPDFTELQMISIQMIQSTLPSLYYSWEGLHQTLWPWAWAENGWMDGWFKASLLFFCVSKCFVFLIFLALSCSLQNLHVVDWQMAARLLQAELYIPEALKRVQGLRKQLFVSGGILGWLGSWAVSRILNSNGYSQRLQRFKGLQFLGLHWFDRYDKYDEQHIFYFCMNVYIYTCMQQTGNSILI